MKILELTGLYPPDIGGTQRHVARQAEELARRGHEVTVVTHSVGDAPLQEVTSEGITVFRTEAGLLSRIPGIHKNARQRFSAPFPELKDLSMIRYLIRHQRPDVVLAHNWIIYSYLAMKRASDPPLIWILHDYSAICHKQSLLYTPVHSEFSRPCPGARLDRCISCGNGQYGWAKSTILAAGLQISRHLLNHKIDDVVAISSAVASKSQGAFNQNIRIIPTFLADGLRDIGFDQLRPSFCPKGEYILYVGSLGAHKGIRVLIEAHSRLHNQIPLVVIGTPVPGERIPSGDNIIVALDVEHRHVMAAWAHCTIGVVPSVWEEPWGQVAAEAATVGKAVVATRVGGLKDVVVDGETGILVAPDDSEELRAAMDLLLVSPETRHQMGQRAAEHVRPFTVSVVTDRIEQAMTRVLASRATND